MIYLGLGSNLGERRENISGALSLLAQQGVNVLQVAPLIETPPLMPENAPSDWFKPFLNTVAAVETDLAPHDLLRACKDVEHALGRDMAAARWAPRVIDVDVLAYHDEILQTDDLTLPHPGMCERAFVQDPLMMLGGKVRRVAGHQPLVMGILNLTPDSFSDGGRYAQEEMLAQTVADWVRAGVHIFDLGAESTRPGAEEITPDEEWGRLQPALQALAAHRKGFVKPWVSVDTRHWQTAEKAAEWGVEIINDVSGLADARMQAVVKESRVQAVAMHSLTVPADKAVTLPDDCDVVEEIRNWLAAREKDWEKAGLDLNKIMIDPGLGFGKTALQSLEILQRLEELAALPYRLLIGHSRKSFMNLWTDKTFGDRDAETLGISVKIAGHCDVLRVHDAVGHMRGLRAGQFVI